jgi:hypothetical protein
MIEELEYVSGGLNAMVIIVKNTEWNELLDNWSTIVSSVATALEDEECEDIRRGND